MVLQLNPHIPLVWRSPSSLQFGVESPLVQLDDVTGAQEQLIAALTSGATRPGLELIAQTTQADDNELDDLLESLAPVLGKPSLPPTGTVAVIGVTTTAARLRTALVAAGLELVPPDTRADLGLLVCHYVVEPQLFGYWLSRDIPHLPIVLTDTGVHVGPLIEPGVTPCLYCLERHRTDADPARPAIASQLWGRTSPVETPLTVSEVVALATRLAVRRLSTKAAAESVAMSLFVNAATGEAATREWVRHPECGCAALPGSDSVPAPLSDPARSAPTTGAAASVLA
jgi:bacteriocin biosynthesis cyclodehydratase domain-containing protein